MDSIPMCLYTLYVRCILLIRLQTLLIDPKYCVVVRFQCFETKFYDEFYLVLP